MRFSWIIPGLSGWIPNPMTGILLRERQGRVVTEEKTQIHRGEGYVKVETEAEIRGM